MASMTASVGDQRGAQSSNTASNAAIINPLSNSLAGWKRMTIEVRRHSMASSPDFCVPLHQLP
jgi:hypothetical protein